MCSDILERRYDPWRALHRRKARANCRGVLARFSPPVGQALFIHAVGRNASTILVLDTELAAIVPTESEFVKITLKVLFAALLVDADHATLEDTKHAFDGIGRHIVAGELLRRMMRRLVRSELGTKAILQAAFIGM